MASYNKQTEIHQPHKLQGGVAIGGVGSRQSFLHCYKYSVMDLRLLCVSEWMIHWFTQYIRHCISTKTKSRSELSADLTGMNVGVG